MRLHLTFIAFFIVAHTARAMRLPVEARGLSDKKPIKPERADKSVTFHGKNIVRVEGPPPELVPDEGAEASQQHQTKNPAPNQGKKPPFWRKKPSSDTSNPGQPNQDKKSRFWQKKPSPDKPDQPVQFHGNNIVRVTGPLPGWATAKQAGGSEQSQPGHNPAPVQGPEANKNPLASHPQNPGGFIRRSF